MFESAASPRIPSELMEQPRWYALRTRARAEKKTHALLEKAGVESFPAVGEVERSWADRTRRVAMPLFPGYIFVRIPLRETKAVLRWPGAVDLVRNGGTPTPVRGEEMDAVVRLARGVTETGALPADADPVLDAGPGDRVRVTTGPFEGLVGVLVETRGAEHVVVRLDALRQAKAVRVAREALEDEDAGRRRAR